MLKALIAIDGPALNGMQYANEQVIDHRKLYYHLIDGVEPVDVVYFAKKPEETISWHTVLESIGYTVKTPRYVGPDVDEYLALEIFERFEEADVISFVGGDHRYLKTLKHAKSHGKLIWVFCPEVMLASAIYDLCDGWHDPINYPELIDHEKTKTRRWR